MRQFWTRVYNNHVIYWRFRYVTRNRLRLQTWFRRRQPPRQYRERGTASVVYRSTGRRSWLILLLMVCVLTALTTLSHHYAVDSTVVYIAEVVVVIGSLYWAVHHI